MSPSQQRSVPPSAALIRGAVTGSWRAAAGPTAAATAVATAARTPDAQGIRSTVPWLITPNDQAERPASNRPAPACCSSDLARAGIRSRAWRRHHAELPQRVEIVDDAALPEHLAVTNLENDDLFELHALSRGGQGPPLTALRSRDR